MNDYVDIPNIQGFVSIKEAAKALGISTKRVYEYITEGRLPAVRAVNALMIPLEELQKFERGASGRERKVVPLWRFSSGKNKQFITTIIANLKTNDRASLIKRLDKFKRDNLHLFPGTIARYFSSSNITPERIEIVFIWRGTIMPDEETRQKEIEAFKQELADLIDWSTAQYDEGILLMHT